MNNLSIKNSAKKELKDKTEKFSQEKIVKILSFLAKRFKKGQILRNSIYVLAQVIKKMKPALFERKLKMKFGLLSNSIPSNISKRTISVIKNLVNTEGKSIRSNYSNELLKQKIQIKNINNSIPTKAQVIYLIIIYLLRIPRTTVTKKEDKFLNINVLNFNKALIKLANVVSKTRV